MKQLIIIDCQHDFIDGTLACHDASLAVENIINYCHEHPAMEVMYSLDWHKPTNHSFKINGGIWPVHCVQNEWGSQLDERFDSLNERQKPQVSNKFYKGQVDEVEEYSAFYAKNEEGEVLNDLSDSHVMIAGIASEFCVMETIRELINDNKKVTVLKSGLGYVDPEGHMKALAEYEALGAKIV